MQKLTLSVDANVVQGAKRYARLRGTSVSRLVETMLRLVSASEAQDPGVRKGPVPPVLARLRGSLARGDRRDHRDHLERKHR
jgi:hypothetical protein